MKVPDSYQVLKLTIVPFLESKTTYLCAKERDRKSRDNARKKISSEGYRMLMILNKENIDMIDFKIAEAVFYFKNIIFGSVLVKLIDVVINR